MHMCVCACACACTRVCVHGVYYRGQVGEMSVDMAAPGILLYRLEVGIEHYNRLRSRPGAGESRKKSFAFTQPGQQEAPHPASSRARVVAAGRAAHVVFMGTYLSDLPH